MAEPIWLRVETVLTLHARSIALHGGSEGVRDIGLLETALNRPLNRFHYDGVNDIFELAATYGIAVSANHPFVDGNKRAALACVLLFLRRNGFRLTADRVNATRLMLAVAAGETEIDQLAEWIRANSRAD